jgi:hypothetical protein
MAADARQVALVAAKGGASEHGRCYWYRQWFNSKPCGAISFQFAPSMDSIAYSSRESPCLT